MEPALQVWRRGIGEDDPGINVVGPEAALHLPVGRAGGFLDLLVGDNDRRQFRRGKIKQEERHPGDAFGFPAAADQPGAERADEKRDAAVEPDEVEDFVDLGQPAGGEKKEAAGRLATTFLERSFGCGDDRAFPKLTQKQAGTSARFHGKEIVDARANVERGGKLASQRFDGRLRR